LHSIFDLRTNTLKNRHLALSDWFHKLVHYDADQGSDCFSILKALDHYKMALANGTVSRRQQKEWCENNLLSLTRLKEVRFAGRFESALPYAVLFVSVGKFALGAADALDQYRNVSPRGRSAVGRSPIEKRHSASKASSSSPVCCENSTTCSVNTGQQN